jgi:hypothetical protein
MATADLKITVPRPEAPNSAYLPRRPETARQVEAILGLPNQSWASVRVEFATDELATATVVLFIDNDQARQLASLLQGPA